MPVARSTDPSTSWEAARSVRGIRESQRAVLVLFRARGAMNDEKLIALYRRHADRLPAQSDSGIRTRRKELVESGLLVDSGRKARMRSGRMSIVWRAVRSGESVVGSVSPPHRETEREDNDYPIQSLSLPGRVGSPAPLNAALADWDGE